MDALLRTWGDMGSWCARPCSINTIYRTTINLASLNAGTQSSPSGEGSAGSVADKKPLGAYGDRSNALQQVQTPQGAERRKNSILKSPGQQKKRPSLTVRFDKDVPEPKLDSKKVEVELISSLSLAMNTQTETAIQQILAKIDALDDPKVATSSTVREARRLLEKLVRKAEIDKHLTAAIEAESIEDITKAIEAAEGIKIFEADIAEAKKIVELLKEERKELEKLEEAIEHKDMSSIEGQLSGFAKRSISHDGMKVLSHANEVLEESYRSKLIECINSKNLQDVARTIQLIEEKQLIEKLRKEVTQGRLLLEDEQKALRPLEDSKIRELKSVLESNQMDALEDCLSDIASLERKTVNQELLNLIQAARSAVDQVSKQREAVRNLMRTTQDDNIEKLQAAIEVGKKFGAPEKILADAQEQLTKLFKNQAVFEVLQNSLTGDAKKLEHNYLAAKQISLPTPAQETILRTARETLGDHLRLQLQVAIAKLDEPLILSLMDHIEHLDLHQDLAPVIRLAVETLDDIRQDSKKQILRFSFDHLDKDQLLGKEAKTLNTQDSTTAINTS